MWIVPNLRAIAVECYLNGFVCANLAFIQRAAKTFPYKTCGAEFSERAK
jgi:hypothetical protein